MYAFKSSLAFHFTDFQELLSSWTTFCKEIMPKLIKLALRAQETETPRFKDSRHMKVVRSSAPRIGRLYPPAP